MKKILLLLIILLLMQTVTAIRISPDAIRIEFEPNFEKSYTFYTQTAENVGISIEGNLAEYVTIEKNNIAKDGTFVIKVKFPEEIDPPGKHLVFIGVTERSRGGGTVTGIASIRTALDIRVPYPGIYAEISFNVRDLNINETANFVVSINNLGKKNIDNAKAVIDILDLDEKIVEKLFTEEKTIRNRSRNTLQVLFNASKHTSGRHKAIAHVTYDDQSKDLEAGFKIGTLNIKIINYTRTFIKDKIANFEIEIESAWNTKIDNIFAEVKVFNSTKEVSSFKTVSVSLEPWGKKILSTFWDTQGLGEGTYDAKITLFYEGQTTKLDAKIEMIIPKEEIQFFKKYLTTTNLLIFAVVMLILINIIIFVRKRKK